MKFKMFLQVISLFVAALFSTGVSAMVSLTANDLQKAISGNSLQIVNKFGLTLVYFDKNGAFRHVSADGRQGSQGSWRINKDSVCATASSNSLSGKAPQEHCINLVGQVIGSPWSIHDDRNGNITYKIIDGQPDVRKLVKSTPD